LSNSTQKLFFVVVLAVMQARYIISSYKKLLGKVLAEELGK
jgi:hypothetical protein